MVHLRTRLLSILLAIIVLSLDWTKCDSLRVSRLTLTAWSKVLQRSAALIAGVSLTLPYQADAAEYKTYENSFYRTSFKYPADWVPSEGKLSGDRALTAFIDPKNADTSISVVFTPIAADFTKLTSFGGKESLRLYLVPKGEGVTTEVLDEKVYGETYYVEYKLSTPDFTDRHIQSVFSLRPQELVVALNIQAPEAVFQAEKEVIREIAPSLRVDPNE